MALQRIFNFHKSRAPPYTRTHTPTHAHKQAEACRKRPEATTPRCMEYSFIFIAKVKPTRKVARLEFAPENSLQATPPLTPVYLLFYPALAAAIVRVAYVNVFAACQQF